MRLPSFSTSYLWTFFGPTFKSPFLAWTSSIPVISLFVPLIPVYWRLAGFRSAIRRVYEESKRYYPYYVTNTSIKRFRFVRIGRAWMAKQAAVVVNSESTELNQTRFIIKISDTLWFPTNFYGVGFRSLCWRNLRWLLRRHSSRNTSFSEITWIYDVDAALWAFLTVLNVEITFSLHKLS